MTVMAAEAVEDTTAAESGTSSLAQTQQQRVDRQNPPPQPSGNQSQGQSASGPSISFTGPKTYHRWLMAEFAACVILTGMTPILSTPKNADGTEVDLDTKSVLFGADALVRLSALCFVFIILALLANNEKAGKFSAAFGGLITAGILVRTSPSIWTKLGDVFGGEVGSGTQSQQSSSSSSSSGGVSGVKNYLSNLPADIKSAAEQALKNLIPWG